jgi:hypothetical protein
MGASLDVEAPASANDQVNVVLAVIAEAVVVVAAAGCCISDCFRSEIARYEETATRITSAATIPGSKFFMLTVYRLDHR